MDQNRLFEAGASGIEEVEEPLSASGDTILLKGYFESGNGLHMAREWFRERGEMTSGEEKIEDWDRSWRDRQTPVEVTPSLSVMPPWVEPPADARFIIRLEAKMAFGTGSHESTRIAATLLERAPVEGASILDIGAGTGILALYAGQLGAKSILALDIDPVSGPCMRENLGLNPLPEECRFDILIGGMESLHPKARFRIVVCNMIRTELWPFREQLRERLEPGGRFLVSGQRLEDKPHFLAWCEASPFRIVEEVEMEGWWGFSATVD